MKKAILLLAFIALGSIAANAETNLRYFVHLKAKNAQERGEIANHIHMDQIIEDSVYATVNEHDFKILNKLFKDKIVESHKIDLGSDEKESGVYEYPKGDEAFHTYAEVMNELKEYAREYSAIATYFKVGTTVEGLEIPGIKISATEQTKNSFTPAILFTGSHHAREHLSTEVPMYLIKYLLENYRQDSRITYLLESREVYFIPMVNPDGAQHDIEGRRYKMWRKNRSHNHNKSRGVDLNRNYSFGWGTGGSSTNPNSDVYMGPKAFSEPETLAVKAFVESNPNIRILLSFHTFSELILYPWGGKYDGVGGVDQQVYEKMARKMATWNRYKPQQASDLYIASGDTCDWAYGEHGIFCFTFELSPKSMWTGGFYPKTKIIPTTVKANILPALYLIEHAASPYDVIKKEKLGIF